MVITLQPLLAFLLPIKIAIAAASAPIVPKPKTTGLVAVGLPVGLPFGLPLGLPFALPLGLPFALPLGLPVSQLNPANTLFAKSVKKPGVLIDPPEPIWSPNAK